MSPKIITSFMLGAATGVGGSFIFFKRKYEKKADEEISEMRELLHQYKKYAKEMKSYADEMYEGITGKEIPKEGFSDDEIRDFNSNKEKKDQNNSKKELNITNLQRHSSINRRREDEKIKDVEEFYENLDEAVKSGEIDDYKAAIVDYTQYSKDKSAYEHPEEEPGIPRIELITMLEYDNDHPEYDKQELKYFEFDDVLCDEHDSPINNAEEVVGCEALFSFGSPDLEDPDIVYVRNNKTSVDYSIVRYEGSYGDFYDIHM